MNTLIFIISYFIFCTASVGLGRLYIYLIQPNNLFEFMQSLLVDLKRENTFLYKSLGGCSICTRQRMTDIAYLFLVFMFNPLHGWYNLAHIALYVFFGGLAFYLDSFGLSNNKELPIVKSEKITFE